MDFRTRWRRAAFSVLIGVMVCAQLSCPVYARSEAEVAFVALGDMPYGPDETAGVRYRRLIQAINQADSEFSIHVGDIKSGSSLCSDEEFLRQRRHFDQFVRPIIYTPGDNEWTDCHRRSNGAYDPIERLSKLRSLFFSSTSSLGSQRIPLETQAELQAEYARYVENRRWKKGGILFVTLHIVGSNNNFETRDPNAVIEFFSRDRANIAWINAAFDLADRQNNSAIVFAFQGNPLETASRFTPFPNYSGVRNSIAEVLLPRAQQFGRPILIVNGDTHEFRFGQPFVQAKPTLKNVFQLVVPGDQDVRAVRVVVRPASASPFTVSFIEP
jgi:hypothetical protein